MLPIKTIGLSFQEKRKIEFQDGSHLGFSTGTILAVVYLQVTPMLPTKFQVNWPFGSGEAKNEFSRRLTAAILDFQWERFSYFYQQVTPMLPTKSQDYWPLGSEAKNRFSRWQTWQPSWISDRNDFTYFRATSQLDFRFRRSEK